MGHSRPTKTGTTQVDPDRITSDFDFGVVKARLYANVYLCDYWSHNLCIVISHLGRSYPVVGCFCAVLVWPVSS